MHWWWQQFENGGGTRQLFYVFWKLEIKNNGLLGTYYFGHDQALLDSIIVNAASPAIQYTDTFKIYGDSVKSNWSCNATGTDSIMMTSSAYVTRIEIEIVPLVTGGVEIGKDDYQTIKVYPNPSSSNLTLLGIDNKRGHLIQVYNLSLIHI